MTDRAFRILVSEPLSQRALGVLRQRGEVTHVNAGEAKDDPPAQRAMLSEAGLAEADALIVRTYTQVDAALLAAAPRLKVVGRAGVAIDNIDVPTCRARGVEVVHTPAANTLAVVDYTIRMILEMNRRFWPMSGPLEAAEFHRTRKQAFGRFVSSLTLGIVGAGRIGSRVGRAAAGLGMTVLYNDIAPVDLDYSATAVEKASLYAASDIVTIHTPLDDSTRGLICAASLAQFKDGAQFINAARGGCMVVTDVAAALHAGKLSAVAIDCHAPEPPPQDYPLWGLPGAILTPHIAARVPQAMENMCDVVYDVLAVLDGQPPQYAAPRRP